MDQLRETTFPPDLLRVFHPIRVLGRGGFGVAILASTVTNPDPPTQGGLSGPPWPLHVVVKVINLLGLTREKVLMAYNEAHVLARLSHPLITSYLHCFFTPSSFYIVTEYAENGGLAFLPPLFP